VLIFRPRPIGEKRSPVALFQEVSREASIRRTAVADQYRARHRSFLARVRPVQAGGGQKAEAQEVTDGSNAADYCVKKGGEVNDRQPFYNTNDVEQNWLRLSGSTQFCKFLSKKDGSRIYAELSTLYTEEPSLAALAYYAEVTYNGNCNGNPASCYCSSLAAAIYLAESTPPAAAG